MELSKEERRFLQGIALQLAEIKGRAFWLPLDDCNKLYALTERAKGRTYRANEKIYDAAKLSGMYPNGYPLYRPNVKKGLAAIKTALLEARNSPVTKEK